MPCRHNKWMSVIILTLMLEKSGFVLHPINSCRKKVQYFGEMITLLPTVCEFEGSGVNILLSCRGKHLSGN